MFVSVCGLGCLGCNTAGVVFVAHVIAVLVSVPEVVITVVIAHCDFGDGSALLWS